MKKRKLVLAFAAAVMTCALSVVPGFAEETDDNHFRAYAGDTGKTTETIYYCNGRVWARVNVEGDDLSNVTYQWKAYYDKENYENGWYDEIDLSGPVLVDNTYSAERFYICEVSDGHGNTREVRFDTAPYQFPGVSSANFVITAGESLDLLPDLQEYRFNGQEYSGWEVWSYYEDMMKISGDTVLEALTPGYTEVSVSSSELDYEFGPFPGAFGVQVRFKDATTESDFWYAPVYWGANRGIVKGYDDGTFRPANNCTRAQMVTFLWRLAGEPEPSSDVSPFKDATNPDTYFYKAMLWGSEKGIVNGYKLKDGTQEFRPGNQCTRQQAVTFMWRYAGEPEPATSESSFKDIRDESTYFYKAVLWAAENGITTGYNDQTFRPTGNCLRRQMVTFLYRFDQDSTSVKINEENFPDAAFRDYICEKIDRNQNGKLEQAEIENTDHISVHGRGIESLQGIEYFTSMWTLDCSDNHLTSLDISGNPGLYSLNCSDNELSSLTFSEDNNLGVLYVSNNNLTELDVSGFDGLSELNCSNNSLSVLDLSDNILLWSVNASNNHLTELKLGANESLDTLNCSNNLLGTLDVSGLTALRYLKCSENYLNSLDLSDNDFLIFLEVYYNPIDSLDLSDNLCLTEVYVDVDQTVTGTDITPTVLMASDDESRIPDAAFRAFLSGFDYDGDGYFLPEDVSTIDVAGTGVESLEGIGWFGNLTYLCCNYNSLTSLDLSGNPDLEVLICDNNDLTELDLSQNPALEDVTVDEGVIITGARDGLVIRRIISYQ